MKFFNISTYQLYLLQLENYELERFWKLLFKKGLRQKTAQRKELVWTMKARLLFVIAQVFQIMIAVYAAGAFSRVPLLGIIVFVLVYLLLECVSFIIYSGVVIILWPFDFLAKKIIVARAKSKILNLKSKITIIGIAGSYGKTTMKEVVGKVLSSKYYVLSTPESVNTPVGIARFILKKVNFKTQILIVEMGEHYQGDIRELCKLVTPDIAIVTGINEAHLERMGNIETITKTIFEIVDGTKNGGSVFVNADDAHVLNAYKKLNGNKKFVEYKIEDAQNPVFDTDKLNWTFDLAGLGKVSIKLLGEYGLGDASAAVKIAMMLGMAEDEIKNGLMNVVPVEHRLQPLAGAGNVLVIDDAYNGNSDGASQAIKLLARFKNRRKIYITPGLVETGDKAADVHREIGRELAEVADVVILIKNSVTGFIEEGMKGYVIVSAPEAILSKEKIASSSDKALTLRNDTAKIIWFNTAQEAHVVLKDILLPGDVVLFQNDWGDQYI